LALTTPEATAETSIGSTMSGRRRIAKRVTELKACCGVSVALPPLLPLKPYVRNESSATTIGPAFSSMVLTALTMATLRLAASSSCRAAAMRSAKEASYASSLTIRIPDSASPSSFTRRSAAIDAAFVCAPMRLPSHPCAGIRQTSTPSPTKAEPPSWLCSSHMQMAIMSGDAHE
jgi:hypothetical protein